ncbi:LysR family transcriptional regulator [Vitreoscilla filiformis]|uniref:LysR family transcriptional regulator n=1 Tax=Vitreoscilla filiformis TaxID=63 RepID=A0A221KHF4_VITFI|nr:LysR family transcriptional regulator [Vitreoscilla filiformis]ASM78359.1 LysR family transcriptional regulator [Vitreoscilla filiformis]
MNKSPSLITHRLIEVFRAVMLTGHVTRAAELLHTSQPTVSRELARLEQVLGFALFERVRGRLQPTVRALALREEVERSFVGLERIAATASGLREFAQGRLELACLPALTHALLPAALASFAAQWPQASVSLTPLESPMLEAALTEQRFDLGLTEQREAPRGTTLAPLFQADEVAVLPAGHPLAQRERLRLEDFAHHPFVSLAPGDPYRQQIDALFTQASVPRQLRLETASAVSVCALVREGLGLAIVNPLTALAMAGEGSGLVMRPLAVSIAFQVAVVCPALRAEHPLRAPLLAALQDAARQAQAQLQAA